MVKTFPRWVVSVEWSVHKNFIKRDFHLVMTSASCDVLDKVAAVAAGGDVRATGSLDCKEDNRKPSASQSVYRMENEINKTE